MHPAVLDQMNAILHRQALKAAVRVFPPTDNRQLRDRQAAEFAMIDVLPNPQIMHFQPNITPSRFGLDHMDPRQAVPRLFELGRHSLMKFDLFINNRLLLEEARYSPFRCQWLAYPEVGAAGSGLHYHLAFGINDCLMERFNVISQELLRQFNSDPRSAGCSVVPHKLNNRRKQIPYILKKIGDDLMYNNRIVWKEFLPPSWPHLVRREGKWVHKKLDPIPARFPRDWSCAE
jgi:hypothetical protein